MKFKEVGVIIILAVIVIGIVFAINYVRGNGNNNEEGIICIAKRSQLVISPTCSACTYQKQILGENYDLFNVISISDNPGILKEYDISGVPAWIINEKAYTGAHSIEELKDLTGC